MNKATLYAQTLHAAEKDSSDFDVFFAKFISYLEKRDEQKLLPTVLRELESLMARDQAGEETILTVAKQEDVEKYTKEISESYKDFDIQSLKTQVDPNIVGGFIARNKQNMIDASYRKGLVQMYQKLVG